MAILARYGHEYGKKKAYPVQISPLISNKSYILPQYILVIKLLLAMADAIRLVAKDVLKLFKEVLKRLFV